ncbi:hypothetical protein CV83906_3969 [Escherichia coli]|nr:hypothetical protein CV83906_3969 [Escherichia coli]
MRRRQLRAKVRQNLRQRAPRQQQNGQRILHPPWRLRMRARRERGWYSSAAPRTVTVNRWRQHQRR